MKKLIIASGIAMAMAAGSAMAENQQSQIQFLGAVTETTCDITSSVDGAVNEVVQLGTVKKGETGEAKKIVLKAKDGTTCDVTGKATTSVVFQGPLGDKGLENSNGSADKATVSLIAKNAKATDQEVKKGQNSIDFEAAKINSGLEFEAKLVSAADGTAGSFDSALAYAVTYQ